MASNLYAAIEALNKARGGVGTLDYTKLLDQAKLQSCDPHDSACVANNVAKEAAVEDFWAQHQGGVPDNTILSFTPLTTTQVQQFYNPNVSQGGNVVATGIMQVNGNSPSYQSYDPGNTKPNYTPSFNFLINRGGQSYLVGDSWKITISGAKPGANVSARANGNLTGFGTVDGNGNWQTSGTFGNGEVGNWDEVWMLDNNQVGHIVFSVGVPASGQNPAGSLVTPATLTNIDPMPVNATNVLTEKFFGVEGWMWGVILVGGFFVVKGRR